MYTVYNFTTKGLSSLLRQAGTKSEIITENFIQILGIKTNRHRKGKRKIKLMNQQMFKVSCDISGTQNDPIVE